MNLDEVLTENAQTRAKLKPAMTRALADVARRRAAAEDVLAKVTAEFDDLVAKAYASGILEVPEITATANIPRSRVYQIIKRTMKSTNA